MCHLECARVRHSRAATRIRVRLTSSSSAVFGRLQRKLSPSLPACLNYTLNFRLNEGRPSREYSLDNNESRGAHYAQAEPCEANIIALAANTCARKDNSAETRRRRRISATRNSAHRVSSRRGPCPGGGAIDGRPPHVRRFIRQVEVHESSSTSACRAPSAPLDWKRRDSGFPAGHFQWAFRRASADNHDGADCGGGRKVPCLRRRHT